VRAGGREVACGAGVLALLWLGCATPGPPMRPVAPGDPAVVAALEAWRSQAAERQGLRALARLAVDASESAGGEALRLRARQRLWLARPGRLRVEVLGLLDGAAAVLAVDGGRYALLQPPARSVERGAVYPGLLWDVARLDLSPEEAVGLLLGAPTLGEGWSVVEASRIGDELQVALHHLVTPARRNARFGPDGALRGLEQRDARGALAWGVRYADYVGLDGAPFAREILLRSDDAEARVVLRDVELNPKLPPELFRLRDLDGEGG